MQESAKRKKSMAALIRERRFIHREPTTQLQKVIARFRLDLHRIHPELDFIRLDKISNTIIDRALAEVQKGKTLPTVGQLTSSLRMQLNQALEREREKKARILGMHALKREHGRKIAAHLPKPSTHGMLPRYSGHRRH